MRLALIALLMCSLPAHAEVPDYSDHYGPLKDGELSWGDRGFMHHEYHTTYDPWVNRLGTSCCNSFDCRPTKVRYDGGSWEALVDGVWRVMEQSRYVRDDGGLGPFASVCASTTGHIWCFDPADPSM